MAVLERDNKTLEQLKETFHHPILSREDCYNIINKITTSGFKLLSFDLTPFDQISGYLGNYYKLRIKILHKYEETVHCFVKTMPKNTSAKNIVQETGCFFKEIFIYENLIPEMHTLGIYIIDECLPACYLQRFEDVIVLEDLSFKNYRTLPSQIPFDLSLLSLTVKKLAKFHASSIIFEEKKSGELGRNYRLDQDPKHSKYLQEIFFARDKTHSGAILMQTGARSVVDVINLFPELKTEQNQKNFEIFWPELQERLLTAIKPSDLYRNVLSHGDLWTNNIMVKFDGEEPIDCAFVDFQITRYCPPAHDFLSVIYLTTDRDTRLKYEQNLKLLYYKELERILELYNFEIGKILSFEEFVTSIEYVRPQMVMQAIMYKSFCLCTSEEISSFLVNDDVSNYVFFEDRKEYLSNICKTSETVRNALEECILDLYDLCNRMSSVM